MNIVQRSALTVLLALAGSGLSSPLLADELALEPTPAVAAAAPGRGTHMDTVLRRFGEPSQRLAAVGFFRLRGAPRHGGQQDQQQGSAERTRRHGRHKTCSAF